MTWKDLEQEKRDDLQYAQRFIDAGFKLLFSQTDNLYKRNTPDFIPHDAIAFTDGKLHIWYCGAGWQVAEIKGCLYSNHRGQAGATGIPFYDRFPETNGYIPNLKTVLELYQKGEL